MLQYAPPSPPLSPNCNAISKSFDGMSTLLGSFQAMRYHGHYQCCRMPLPSPPLSPNCNAISKSFDGMSTLLGSFQAFDGHYQCCRMLFPHHLYHPIAMRYLNLFDGMSTLLGSFQGCHGLLPMASSPPLSRNCNAISKFFDGMSTLLGSFQGFDGHYQCCRMLFLTTFIAQLQCNI